MKKYQVLLSQRYLRSRVVNLVAVVAVMLGVAALILVTSVMTGFARDIEERIRGIMSHIVIDSEQLIGIGDYEHLMRRIEKVPQVRACAPLVESPFVLLRVGRQTQRAMVRGIDIEREKETSEIETYVGRLWKEAQKNKQPPQTDADKRTKLQTTRRDWVRETVTGWLAKDRLDFKYPDGTEPKRPGMLVGVEFAGLMGGLRPGEEVSVTSPTTILTFQTQEFDIVGGFESGHYEYDSRLVYVPLDAAQNLLGLPGRVTSISVRLHDIRTAGEAKKAIEKAIRNATPLADPAAPESMKRLEAVSGSLAVRQDGGDSWICVSPAAGKNATLVIKDVAPILKQADRPTTIALDVRLPKTLDPAVRPWFQLTLTDAAGRKFYPDVDQPVWYPPDSESAQVNVELANFISADGLDLLDPSSIVQAAIDVHGAPVEFSNIRFEDDRRLLVSTWRDKQGQLLRAVEVERYIQVVIMTLMVVIAGFGILAILWLMVKEKTRDIGILRSLGATRGGIVRIFLLNGLMIGAAGAFLGLAAGWAISANLNLIEDRIFVWTGWRVFPKDIYYLDRLPHQENPTQFCIMALLALVISLLAALWPAIKASRLDPVEALRYE